MIRILLIKGGMTISDIRSWFDPCPIRRPWHNVITVGLICYSVPWIWLFILGVNFDLMTFDWKNNRNTCLLAFDKSFFKKTSPKKSSFRYTHLPQRNPPPLELRCFEPPPVSPRSPCLSVAAHDANSLQGGGSFPPTPFRRRPSRVVTCGSAQWGWLGFSYLKRCLGNSPSCGWKGGFFWCIPIGAIMKNKEPFATFIFEKQFFRR